MLSKSRESYLKKWLMLFVLAESAMILSRYSLWIVYLVIASIFLVGVLLRRFNLYPGDKEPLILDFSAVLISILLSYLSFRINSSRVLFLLIFLSPVIILPHIIYIIQNTRKT